MISKYLQKIKIVSLVLGIILILGILYSFFFQKNNPMFLILFLVVGLVLGAILMYLLFKNSNATSRNLVKENSHTIIESMKKVFKIVCAEGYFSELMDYEETQKILGFIPSTKKALLQVKAKVLVGFDFEKCIWELNEDTQKVIIKEFPKPEILSIEPDVKYYNLENGLFNKFEEKDHTELQSKAKKQIQDAAEKSDLPKLAYDQMHTLLKEVLEANHWSLEDNTKLRKNIQS